MKPKVNREDKIELWLILADGKWHKASSIVLCSQLWKSTRIIRAVCESEPDKFISSQKGYKRVDFATDEELEEARNDLMSRASKMLERAQGVDRAIASRKQPELRLVR